MTHFDMLSWLDIYTFYFYKPLLFQIFAPWKFIKTEAFPYILPVLQSTATQITISINMFICFKYYTMWNQFFLIKIHVNSFFLLKYTLRYFYIQIWFKYETPFSFFLIEPWTTEKNIFIEKMVFFCRIYKNYWITYCTQVVLYVRLTRQHFF